MTKLNSQRQPITRRIHPDEIYTELDLMYYLHQRLGNNFRGVPGISIPAFTFSLLDPLLSRAGRIDLPALRDIVVVPSDCDLFITTHIESDCAGDRACAILTSQAKNALDQEFVVNLRTTILAQHQNHHRWKANGGRIFRLIPNHIANPITTGD